MASTALQPARPQTLPATRNPLILWHLLSLDAATVAALWTWFIARACGIRLPAASIAAMFLAVWILYAADRLLDARVLDTAHAPPCRLAALEARHYFHQQHRAGFLSGIAVASLVLLALLPRLNRAALELFQIEAALLTGWFFLLHVTPLARLLPKELALGAFFSAAIFIPAAARQPASWTTLLPAALVFAMLCSLNCLFIHRWETSPLADPAHPTTRFAARHIHALATAGLGCCIVLALAAPTPPQIPLACAASIALLLALDRHPRATMDRTTLRAAADLALLTPLLLLPFCR